MPSHLFEFPDWSQVQITGKDSRSFLHSFSTNDIQNLSAGQGCEAFIPDIKGRILAHVLIFADETQLTLVSVPESNQTLVPHLTKYLLGVEAEVEDLTRQRAALCLWGDEAAAQLQSVFDTEPPSAMYAWTSVNFEQTTAMLCRVPLSNADCFLILLEHHQLPALANALTDQGAVFGEAQAPGNSQHLPRQNAFHRQRIAAGFPWAGVDITSANIAQEAARTDRAISFKKGCYLGQEPIARLDAMGHTNKELRGLAIQTSNPIPPGSPVWQGTTEAGVVTSAATAPDEPTLALAMLKAKFIAPATELEVETGGQRIPAQVYWPAWKNPQG